MIAVSELCKVAVSLPLSLRLAPPSERVAPPTRQPARSCAQLAGSGRRTPAPSADTVTIRPISASAESANPRSTVRRRTIAGSDVDGGGRDRGDAELDADQ